MGSESVRRGSAIKWAEPYTLLILSIGAYFAVRFSQVIIGPVIPLILEDFKVARGAIGAALTWMWIAYALLQLPSGVLADQVGERRVVLIAVGVTVAATSGLVLAPTFLLFTIAVVGIGMGAGAYYNPATALLTRELNDIGGVIGAHRLGGQVAGVLAPVVVALISVQYGWRVAVGLGAALALIVAGLFLWKTKPSAPVHPNASFREQLSPRPLFELATRPHTRNTTFLMALVEFVGLATMAFLPTFLVEYHGYSLRQANLLFAVFFAISALSQPLGGWLSDRIGRDTTVAIQSIAGVLGYSALVTSLTSIVIGPAVVLAGIATSSTPVLQSRMIDGLATANHGKGFGLFRTLYLLIGSTGTGVVGTVADIAGWRPAFGILAVLLCAVLLALIVIGIGD